MGIAIDSLSDIKTFIQHNPIILAAGWGGAIVLGIFNFVTSLVLGIIPLVGPFLSMILSSVLAVLFLAGMLGLIYSGRNGSAELSDAFESIQENSLRLFGVSAIFGAIFFVATIGSVVVAVFVMPMGSAMNAGPGAGAGIPMGFGAALLPVLVVPFLFSLLFLLFQFFDVAIVIDDTSLLGSLRRSLALVSAAPLSVVGYSLLRGAIVSLFVFGPLAALVAMISSAISGAIGMGGPGSDLLGAVGIGAIVLVLAWYVLFIPLAGILSLTYHVAFYNRHRATGTI